MQRPVYLEPILCFKCVSVIAHHGIRGHPAYTKHVKQKMRAFAPCLCSQRLICPFNLSRNFVQDRFAAVIDKTVHAWRSNHKGQN
jgi:hypothetical protein